MAELTTVEGLRALLDADTVADVPMGSVVETETDGESCGWLRCGYADGTWFPDGGDEDDWADSATVAAYGGRLSAVAVPVGLLRELLGVVGRERAAARRSLEAAQTAAASRDISTNEARSLADWHHPPGAAALIYLLAGKVDAAREGLARLAGERDALRLIERDRWREAAARPVVVTDAMVRAAWTAFYELDGPTTFTSDDEQMRAALEAAVGVPPAGIPRGRAEALLLAADAVKALERIANYERPNDDDMATLTRDCSPEDGEVLRRTIGQDPQSIAAAALVDLRERHRPAGSPTPADADVFDAPR